MTDFDVEVFHDGACPLCLREISMIRRPDRRRRRRLPLPHLVCNQFLAAALSNCGQ